MEGLTLSRKEQGRVRTLNQVLEGVWRVDEAARVMGVSERHVWRLLAAYRKEGVRALAHGNRGHRPQNAVSEELRREVRMLARDRYGGFMRTGSPAAHRKTERKEAVVNESESG